MAAARKRPEVPQVYLDAVAAVLERFPEVRREAAWTGVRWRVRGRTVAHLFGGEDQLFRITFRGEPDEVVAFAHMGDPYFRSGWGTDAIGMLVDGGTDWEELAELLTDAYCIRAPAELVEQVERPGSLG